MSLTQTTYLTGFEVCAPQIAIHGDVAVHLGVLFHQRWIGDVFKAVQRENTRKSKRTTCMSLETCN